MPAKKHKGTPFAKKAKAKFIKPKIKTKVAKKSAKKSLGKSIPTLAPVVPMMEDLIEGEHPVKEQETETGIAMITAVNPTHDR